MKKLLFAALAATMLAMPAAEARSLSPEEALSQVAGQTRKAIGGQDSDLQLAYTVKSDENGANALYVFTKDQLGFAVVAADDAVEQLLLAYSDESAFDAQAIHPAMRWYLDASAAAVDQQIALQASGRQRLAAPAKEYAAIRPLVSTKWNQGDPYNQKCPMVGGKRSVTGCVATAMAQIMNYHQWPVQGTGSHTYSWTVNGTSYSDTYNFGNTTFDWDNMLDVYTSSASQVQKDAVAELMHACGNAAEMTYTPNESGAVDLYAAMGIVNYLGYDPTLSYRSAGSYTKAEWDGLIYGELAAGRPVMYAGRDITDAGHEFVCDGYAGNGYFHINWGWGGMSDGYFTLPDLNPDGQGIGGGSGQSGFSFGQSAIVGIQPPMGSSSVTAVMIAHDFGTSAASYSRSARVSFTGGYYSYSLATVTVSVGVHIVGNGIDQYISSTSATLDPFDGWSSFNISASSFPLGTYNVYPAFKPQGGEWQDMPYNKRNLPDGLLFNVTSEGINITTTESEVSAKFTGISTNDGVNDIYSGATYVVEYEVTSTGPWSGTLQPMLLAENSNGGYVKVNLGDSRAITFEQAETRSEEFNLPISSDLATGDYYLALTEYADGFYIVSDILPITVTQQAFTGCGALYSIERGGAALSTNANAPTIITLDDTELTFTVLALEGPWVERVNAVYFESTGSGYLYAGESEMHLMSIEAGYGATFTTDIATIGLQGGKNYIVFAWGDTNGQLASYNNYWYYFQYNDEYKLSDATTYDRTQPMSDINVRYSRTFNNTEWQPLYVPFDMAYEDWADQAEVAELEGVIMRDTDRNGTIDYTIVTFTTVLSGKIKANTPYIIKAKATGDAVITCSNTTLHAAAENYVDCSTTSHNFYLRGVYERKADLSLDDHYIMSEGTFHHTTGGVKPMRFYLEKEARPEYGSHAPQRAPGQDDSDDVIYIEVDGEIAGTIDMLVAPQGDGQLYDLQGRKVTDPTPGIYVRNGQKVVIK